MDTRYQFVKQQYHFQKKLTDKEREKARKLRDEQQAYQCNLATEKVKQQHHVKQANIKVSKPLYPPGINKRHVSSFLTIS